MGKRNRLQRRLKSEKAKTQIKARTKFLPKGLNVTNAEFKIKQIVVPSQSVLNTDVSEGHRNLNLKEILKKLKHHNEKIKIKACEELSFLITKNRELIQDLYVVIQSIGEIIQEQMTKPRREGINVVKNLLQTFGEKDIDPHFHYFSVNLRCAMTHIDKNVREDSIRFLGLFLSYCPKLIARHSSQILPNFLMLISDVRNHSDIKRSLSINLKSTVTSTQWRISVLMKFCSILKEVISFRRSSERKELIHYPTVNGANVNETPLFKSWKCFLNPSDSLPQEKNETDVHMQLVSVFPLLLGIWLEGADERPAHQDVTYLSEENATLLNCITSVLYMIMQLLESEKDIIKSAAKLIDSLAQNLPYRMKNVPKPSKTGMEYQSSDANCSQENHIICYFHLVLYASYHGAPKVVHQKVVNVIRDFCHSNVSSKMDVGVPLKILQLILVDQSRVLKATDVKIDDILEDAISLHKKQVLNHELDHGLLEILANVRNTRLRENSNYIDWLKYLPQRLLHQNVNEKNIVTFLRISSKCVEPFNQAYMEILPRIIGNLNNINVTGTSNPNNAKLKILDILFYASTDDETTWKLLQNLLGEDSPFWPYLVKLFSMKRYMR